MELKVKNNTIIFCLQLLVFYSLSFFFSNLILKVTLLVSTETSSLAIVLRM